MFFDRSQIAVGTVKVFATTDRGYSPEELAEMAISKIISIGDVPQPIKEQVEAYKERIQSVLIHYLDAAQKEERKTVARRLAKNGYETLAAAVERGTL